MSLFRCPLCASPLTRTEKTYACPRGHSFDREVLAQALKTDAFYIGMIGSSSKKASVYKALRAQGVSDAALDKVCCPIGLGIGADTPQQIAVSVVAELMAARAGTLGALRAAR